MAVVLLVYIVRRARTELNKTVEVLDPARGRDGAEFDLLEKGQSNSGVQESSDIVEFFDGEKNAK